MVSQFILINNKKVISNGVITDSISGFDSDFENELNMKVCDFYDVFNYAMYV